jgi:hypothetical protein
MKVKATDICLSIGLGLLAIYAAHDFFVVDACLDMGSAIDEATGSRLDNNYHEQRMVFSPALLVIYFFIGLVVSLVSVLTIKALRGTKGD